MKGHKSDVPKNHPRYHSLIVRETVKAGVKKKITSVTGLIAYGRGEAFDYLLGERTHNFAKSACRAAAALLLLAEKPIISVNGNTAVQVPKEMIDLARASRAELEINLFHRIPGRRGRIVKHLKAHGAKQIYGLKPDANLTGLTSERGWVDSRGMLIADVVLVSLEDGDRTEILMNHGKKVIAIDLNPFSRTPRKANISIIDNVTRALPCIKDYVKQLKGKDERALSKILAAYDNRAVLKQAERAIRTGKIG